MTMLCYNKAKACSHCIFFLHVKHFDKHSERKLFLKKVGCYYQLPGYENQKEQQENIRERESQSVHQDFVQ